MINDQFTLNRSEAKLNGFDLPQIRFIPFRSVYLDTN